MQSRRWSHCCCYCCCSTCHSSRLELRSAEWGLQKTSGYAKHGARGEGRWWYGRAATMTMAEQKRGASKEGPPGTAECNSEARHHHSSILGGKKWPRMAPPKIVEKHGRERGPSTVGLEERDRPASSSSHTFSVAHPSLISIYCPPPLRTLPASNCTVASYALHLALSVLPVPATLAAPPLLRCSTP